MEIEIQINNQNLCLLAISPFLGSHIPQPCVLVTQYNIIYLYIMLDPPITVMGIILYSNCLDIQLTIHTVKMIYPMTSLCPLHFLPHFILCNDM